MLKAFSWKAQTDLEKRPAPMRRRKLVMTTMKMVSAVRGGCELSS